jgi:beta-N-acetylhexosaminidase
LAKKRHLRGRAARSSVFSKTGKRGSWLCCKGGVFKPAIIGVAGTRLAARESACLAAGRPLGVILFARNVDHPEQLAALIGEIRGILPHALLMVDQEGGRVARLRPPYWRALPPARALATPRAAWLSGALIGLACRDAGFDVVTAPVLDVASPDGHDVIGDRSFAADPATVAACGAAMADGLLAAGIQPVGKHAPGHGRSRADSHLELPVLEDVAEADLLPFVRNRRLPWLMTAHIRYTCQDMHHPATHSAAIIATIIRDPAKIGFDGVLVSDDLAMRALSGAPGMRARRAVEAGCDVALHCSGVLDETEAVLAALPEASPACLSRLAAARDLAQARRVAGLDARALAAELAALLA